MSADTNPGKNFQTILNRYMEDPRSETKTIVEGIKATRQRMIDTTNIIYQFMTAEPQNSYGYEPGSYLVTNVRGTEFQKQNGSGDIERILANVTLTTLVPYRFSEEIYDGIAITPRYEIRNGGIIFQLGDNLTGSIDLPTNR